MGTQHLISINVTEISSEEELISLILNEFNFPDLYGRSWKAMEEHLFYDSMRRVPEKLEVVGFNFLKGSCPKTASQFKQWASSSKDMDVLFLE